MNCKNKKTTKFLSVLLTIVFVFTLMGPITSSLTLTGNASVKSKTQGTANKLFKSGATKGIDVSKWQGGINWRKVANDGVEFAFIRSSYGTNTDPYFVSNAQAAHKNGVKVGAYHFACFKDSKSMKKEAQFFLNQLKKVNITYPVVLDLEKHYGLSKNELTKLALQFINIIEKEGYDVMLYSYQNFIDHRLNKTSLAKTDLWVANYLKRPTGIPHKIWQHTSVGKVNGITGNVDINVAFSDLSSAEQNKTVNKTISNNIFEFINTTYKTDVAAEGSVSLSKINETLMKSLQKELDSMITNTVVTDGVLRSDQIRYIASLDLKSANNQNLIKLLQSSLFYTGIYTEDITGVMDEHTIDSLQKYQAQNDIAKSGTFCADTIACLFNVKLSPADPAVLAEITAKETPVAEELSAEEEQQFEQLEEEPEDDLSDHYLTELELSTETVAEQLSETVAPTARKAVFYSDTGEIMDS